ncbi:MULTISPECIES: hypothetical protein [unclassified Microcoleus]|nr:MULTISPECIES: hypothetical protein [unclassified Microcoleus]MCC3441268.1 hypothetical protein [Microcoleus sp. PH2017_03_ELD_O_A]MCC3466918.1 hypothetical protein [Microcoleus sp. PH2017_06_SFM_O_A]MCC3502570.1 hypothetical protein [Microcoleus sp. PH2017_19_SFW_U_A]MCC3511305.1 hypothetical protein [Microcoleus sp. PH2017_17_BER_D_A]MCC3522872.1 hypothetical protein [Microcoleus sp. PH2017_20_SFW_D_A]MCC3547092.1 hypothetical protein [Microcoleus sp. PH2017_24_DOB_U_A]MCC3553617.1 hypot
MTILAIDNDSIATHRDNLPEVTTTIASGDSTALVKIMIPMPASTILLR